MLGVEADNSSLISELIIVCDDKGLIRFVSRSFTRFFGGNPESWFGKPFAPGNNEAEIGRPARYRTNAKANNRKFTINWTETCLAGGERLYSGIPSEFLDKNQLSPPNESDGTDNSANDPRLKLLAMMSHEMRTPLNGILGMTNLLLDTNLNLNQQNYAESVRESGVALLALINDLLDYSKMHAGRLELEQRVFDPFSLVQGVAELLSPKAAERDIEIVSFVDPQIPKALCGDETRLRQVLINLAGNGVKFTDHGGVCVEMHMLGSDKGQVTIRVLVRDTGVGIPAAMQDKIFEEFSQVKQSVGERREGTGLGLSIAQNIIQSMGGEIRVVSKEGAGSAFSFDLALDFVEPNEKAETDAHAISEPVIIAAANPVLSYGLKTQLTSLGAKSVLITSSAAELAGAIDTAPSSIVFCDVGIANDLGDEWRKQQAHAFALLSLNDRNKIETLSDDGFDGYFIKPVRLKSLKDRINSPQNARNQNPAPKSSTVAPVQLKSLKVLLAEDNHINAVLATTIVKRSGHDVVHVLNGHAALEALATGTFDIVLMDMHMPELDGLQATRQIRATDADFASIPIVALTASASEKDRLACMNAGMTNFLTKPFEPSELTRVINECVTANREGIAKAS